MIKTNVKIKNKHGTDVVYEDISTISLDGEDGTKKTFSYGKPTSKEIALDFSEGNQEVIASDEELYEKVTIIKPDNLSPNNIAQGVVVAGIEGTFEGAREMPTLNKPTISRSGDKITISNPSSNGNFNKSFNVYGNDDLIFNQTANTFSLAEQFEAEQDYKMEVTCVNPLMNESDRSNCLNFSVYSVDKVFDEFISTIDTTTKISDSLPYSFIVKSAFGYWLPEIIKVYKKKNGSDEYILTDNYDYSMYRGLIEFATMDSNIKIVINADEEPQLKRVNIKYDPLEYIIKTDFTRYNERLDFYDNNELFHYEIANVFNLGYSLQNLESKYTFEMGSDGYYQPNNKDVNSSFAIVRINFVNEYEPTSVNLIWRQSTEAGYDYGVIGKIDVPLLLDTSSTNAAMTMQNKTYTTDQILELDLPLGNHFYDIKYRKDGSAHAGWDMFEFKIELENLILKMSQDQLNIDCDYVLTAKNSYFINRTSANATHHIYIDNIKIHQEKEGI